MDMIPRAQHVPGCGHYAYVRDLNGGREVLTLAKTRTKSYLGLGLGE